MSAASLRRYRDARVNAFRNLRTRWLAKLPANGWEGTSHQLGDELYAFGERNRLYAYVPTCPGRQMADLSGLLAANGHALTYRRSKRARTLWFTRTNHMRMTSPKTERIPGTEYQVAPVFTAPARTRAPG